MGIPSPVLSFHELDVRVNQVSKGAWKEKQESDSSGGVAVLLCIRISKWTKVGGSGFSNGNWDNIVLLCRSERFPLCGLTPMNTDEHLCLAQRARVQKALRNKCSTPHHSMEGGKSGGKERKREERDSEDYCREEEKYLAKYILHR